MSLLVNIAIVAGGILFGFLYFYLSVSNQVGTWLHLRSFFERLGFFFKPFPPKNMLVLIWPDGAADIFVDVEVGSDSKGYTIRTPAGTVWTPKLRWHNLAMTETSVVPREPSPYALAWRTLAGWIAGWVFAYYGLVLNMPENVTYTSPEWLIPLTLLLMVIIYIVMLVTIVSTPNLPATALTVRGISPPSMFAEPAEGPLGISPKEKAKLKGRDIIIKVPEDAKETLEEIKEMMQVPEDKAAEILAKLSLFSIYRRSLVAMQAHFRPLQEIARSMLRVQISKITLGRGLLLLLAFAAGYLLAYFTSGSVMVGPPPEHVNSTIHAMAGGGVP